MTKRIITLSILSFLLCACSGNIQNEIPEGGILSYKVNLQEQDLNFYWKDEQGKFYKNFDNLKDKLNSEGKELVFAMNGGLYHSSLTPTGLYIENGEVLNNIERFKNGAGNFYMQPNGVFYITNANQPFIAVTDSFKLTDDIKYATQSGPMLLIDGDYNSQFTAESENVNRRNGVGILPNGDLLFAMSTYNINFFDFATYFKNEGCKNALYLDGFVSKTYLPSKNWVEHGGEFAIIIAETKDLD
ncbi:phosphodiester glycosidase family protein [Paracrocinitomix mangrovi]|uniref:phosphodiester glycosidase family protein n=1 Tax=Paracrocinitomix mangrovi TaxID=2862509 RepID=UPI001C8E760F|nr:phosphodiester glycosidase family protein [Paracrocinitomix mangrovi]UKN03189.1 phosphodiester glycosidase family protein [Paracrocinitomix mangrovi]